MKVFKIIFAIALFTSVGFAQKAKEFEGKIYYSHTVTAIDLTYHIDDDYGYMGKSSVFHYKHGKYKWLNDNAFIVMDMFDNAAMRNYIQLQNNDSILRFKSNAPNEELLSHTVIKGGDKVMGKVCDVLVIKAGSNGNNWERRYSYAKEFAVDPESFKNYKYNSTDQIYAIMKAVPLKIELIYKNRKITYTATKIEKAPIADAIFVLPETTLFKDQK